MSVYQNKGRDGWFAEVWFKGKRVFRDYFATKDQAEEEESRARVRAYDSKIDRPAAPEKPPSVRVRSAFARWLKDLRELKRSKHTIRFYQDRGKRTLLAEAGPDGTIEEMTPARVEEWFARERASKRKAIDYEKIRATWRAFFRWCVKKKLIAASPLEGVPKLEELATGEPTCLTEAQIAAIITKSAGKVRLWAILAFRTGMRPREVEGARFEWIDLAAQIVRVPRKVAFTGKTGSRSIPLHPELKSEIKALAMPEGPILTSQRTGGAYAYNGSRQLARAAGSLIGVALTPYDARHTFCSHLVAAGVPLHEVMEVMGHSRIETTMKYAHLAPDYQARVRWAMAGGRLAAVGSVPLGDGWGAGATNGAILGHSDTDEAECAEPEKLNTGAKK